MPWSTGPHAWFGHLQSRHLLSFNKFQLNPASGGELVFQGIRFVVKMSAVPFMKQDKTIGDQGTGYIRQESASEWEQR